MSNNEALIQINVVRKKIDDANKEAKAIASEKVREVLTNLFTEHPVLKSFRWTQYTPYFNDGDECIFGVNEASFLFVREENDETKIPVEIISSDVFGSDYLKSYSIRNLKDNSMSVNITFPSYKEANNWCEKNGYFVKYKDDDEDDMYIDYWEVSNPYRDSNIPKDDPCVLAANAVQDTINEIGNDIMKYAFGDHVEVIFKRNHPVEVIDHEHD